MIFRFDSHPNLLRQFAKCVGQFTNLAILAKLHVVLQLPIDELRGDSLHPVEWLDDPFPDVDGVEDSKYERKQYEAESHP